jgi:hypothetical protein
VDILQLDQVERWRDGERVPAEAYLKMLADKAPTSDQGARSDESLDLVYAEFLLRRELGEAPTLAEYQWRFPEFADQLPVLIKLEEELEQCSSESSLLNEGHHGFSLQTADRQSSEHVADSPCIHGYEILGILGRGGMGVVYKARQIGLNRLIALKVIRAGQDADPASLERFRVEAETVAQLQHPNIVQVYEVGESDGCPYMALELAEGGSLAQFLDGTPQPPLHAARFVETLARAMHFAHLRGIIHRDLKPANVLLQLCRSNAKAVREPVGSRDLESTIPKISDFGLAKAGRTPDANWPASGNAQLHAAGASSVSRPRDQRRHGRLRPGRHVL